MRVAYLLPWEVGSVVTKHISPKTFFNLMTAMQADPRFDVFIPQTVDEIAKADILIIPRIVGFHLQNDEGPYKTLFRDVYRALKTFELNVPFAFYSLDVQSFHFDAWSNWLQWNCDILLTPAMRPFCYPTQADYQVYVPYSTHIMADEEKFEKAISFPSNVSRVAEQLDVPGTRIWKFMELVKKMPDYEFHVYGMGWQRISKTLPDNLIFKGVANNDVPYSAYKWVLDVHPDTVIPEKEQSVNDKCYTIPNWEEKRMTSDRVFYAVSGLAHPITDKKWLKDFIPSCIEYEGAEEIIRQSYFDLDSLRADRERLLAKNVFCGTLHNLDREFRAAIKNPTNTLRRIEKANSEDTSAQTIYNPQSTPSQKRFTKILDAFVTEPPELPVDCPGFAKRNSTLPVCKMCPSALTCTLQQNASKWLT